MRLFLILLAVTALAQTRESIEQQLRSVEQQREAIRRFQPDLALEPACDPMPEDEIAPLIDKAAGAQRLPPKLLRAVIEQESGSRPCAVSDTGAQGLMQLMPATATELQVEDPFDPASNIAAGARLLRQLLEKYKGELAPALAAYNAGPETVEKAGGIPDIPETRGYVEAIVARMGIKHIDLPEIPPPKDVNPPRPPATSATKPLR